MLSSLGVVDNYIGNEYDGSVGKVYTEGFWLGVEMLTPGVMCHVWTRECRMMLSERFHESFYSENYVRGFLKRVKELLVKGLSVAEETISALKKMNVMIDELMIGEGREVSLSD